MDETYNEGDRLAVHNELGSNTEILGDDAFNNDNTTTTEPETGVTERVTPAEPPEMLFRSPECWSYTIVTAWNQIREGVLVKHGSMMLTAAMLASELNQWKPKLKVSAICVGACLRKPPLNLPTVTRSGKAYYALHLLPELSGVNVRFEVM